MSRCLYCYEELQPGDTTLHVKCSRRVFSQSTPPTLPYSPAQIAEQNTKELYIEKQSNTLQFIDESAQYTILSGDELLLEAVAMRMADIGRVSVAPHTLIRSTDGAMHHIRRSIAHGKKGADIEVQKLSDLAVDQTDSYESIAEILKKHSTTPKLDIINLYERVLFCYLVGDTQLDLASFSMAKTVCGSSLSPASSIIPRTLTTPNSSMAMSLNGKQNDLTRTDFESAMRAGGLESKIIDNLFSKFEKLIDEWCNVVDSSPLSEELKESLKFQMIIRFDTL
ncbi:MAG: HipA domain-containing protein [Rikenellaceae bacterium]